MKSWAIYLINSFLWEWLGGENVITQSNLLWLINSFDTLFELRHEAITTTFEGKESICYDYGDKVVKIFICYC